MSNRFNDFAIAVAKVAFIALWLLAFSAWVDHLRPAQTTAAMERVR